MMGRGVRVLLKRFNFLSSEKTLAQEIEEELVLEIHQLLF